MIAKQPEGRNSRRVPPWLLGVCAALAIGIGAVVFSVLATPREDKPAMPPPPSPPPLTAGEIEAKVTGSAGTAHECFEGTVDREVTKIRVTLIVRPDGSVVRESVRLSQGSRALPACLVDMVAGWTFRPNPGGQFGFVIARPDADVVAECDEVSCVLNNYEGACCHQYKRGNRVDPDDITVKPDPVMCDEVTCVLSNYEGACCMKYRKGKLAIERDEVPEALDRLLITEGINVVKPAVIACGDKHPAQGTVKVSVKVAPSGTPESVTLKQSPNPGLGSCVVSAIKKARFARTQAGGSFSYPFVF